MDSFEELYLLMKYLHKRREENKIKEKERKERKRKEEEMRQSELKEMVRKLQESWQQLRKLMELEMQKWYLPVKKKITWPIKKIFQKRKMQERKNKVLQEEEVENEMESIPVIFLTSRIEEAKVNIIVEESFCHFQPHVQNEKTKMVVYNQISNEDDSCFFKEVYEFSQRYYVNCGHCEYVDILFVEDINDYGTKVYTEEMEFWILKDEKMLSRIWVKKNKRKRDPVIVAKMNDKMSKDWKTRKKAKKKETCIPLSQQNQCSTQRNENFHKRNYTHPKKNNLQELRFFNQRRMMQELLVAFKT